MLSSLIEQGRDVVVHGLLSDARVLVTGVLPESGGAVVAALAGAGARLFVQAPGTSPEIAAIAAGLARSGARITVVETPVTSAAGAVRFAQGAARALGGFDAVINIITLADQDREIALGSDDVEENVHDLFLPASLITRVGANRMRTTQRDGALLNVLVDSPPETSVGIAFSGYARAAFGAMTRLEAREWASSGLRVNGLVANGANLPSTEAAFSFADAIAVLTLYLMSGDGRRLSGHILDTDLVSPACLGASHASY